VCTMWQRLLGYPRELDKLFDRMFSGIEDIHHKSVALYFYAARQRSFSIALTVASQRPQKLRSIEHFGALCEHEITRIATQSRGLLQVDYVNGNGHDWTRGWSLRDLTNGHIRTDPIEQSDLQLITKYTNTSVAFVHRSAYDYVFDDTADKRPKWVKTIGEPDMIQDVLDGILWLAQYRPIVATTHSPKDSTLHFRNLAARNTITLEQQLATFTADESSAPITADKSSTLSRKQFFYMLDHHLDTICAWTAAQKNDPTNAIWRYLLSDRPAALNPLTGFWVSILKIKPEYLASRLQRFWDCDDAYSNMMSLLQHYGRTRPWLNESWEVASPATCALHSVLAGFRFHGRANSSIIDFPYAGKEKSYLFGEIWNDTSNFVSWYGTGNTDEFVIAPRLARAPRSIFQRLSYLQKSGQHVARAILGTFTQVYAMFETWKLFEGAFVGTPPGTGPSPLQLSLPLYHLFPSQQYCPALLNGPSSHGPTLVFRLSCFARHPAHPLETPQYLSPFARDWKPVNIVATYNLSPTATTTLKEFSREHDDDYPVMMTRFTGTMAELSTCINMILTELWDDKDNQLTAWEQLYTRACVRFYFSYFWVVSEEKSKINGGA
jgi:hypothetical protein